MNPFAISVLLLTAALVFGLFVWQKLTLLISLAPVKKQRQIGKRIGRVLTLALAQKKLIGRKKERASGAMHAFIFWGFLIIQIRTITLIGEGFQLGFHLPFLGENSIFGYLYLLTKDLIEGLVLALIFFAVYRRWILKPARLTNSFAAWFVLLMIGGLMITDLLYDAARFNIIKNYGSSLLPWFNHPQYGAEFLWTPLANLLSLCLGNFSLGASVATLTISYWLHIVTVLVFLCFLPMGKHAHVLTALPNVFLMSLNSPHTPVAKLDLEDEQAWEDEALGINHIYQFSWKEGLDLLTCTECGRCLEVCPTHVTNKPLSLKTFNDSLKHEMFTNPGNIIQRSRLKKKLWRTENEADRKQLKEQMQKLQSSNQLVGDVIAEETLWACTTCRACEQVCPLTIEHVPRIIAMRQGQTLMAESYPSELNSAFKGLDRNFNPWGIGYDQRADWAKGLDIPLVKDNPKVDYLLWVGCAGAFDDQGQKVTRAMAQILKQAGVNFAILGTEEKCTGDFARRTGNELLFQTMAKENIELLNSYQITKIITTCPHCLNTLDHEYPEFGGNYELIHHSQFITQLIADNKISLNKTAEGKITYHDPCYLGRYEGIYNAPRDVIKAVAQEELREMPRHREESFCCGAGGGRIWMEENIGERININRVSEAVDLGADQVVVACPFCLTMMRDGIKELGQGNSLKTLDLAELVWNNIQKLNFHDQTHG